MSKPWEREWSEPTASAPEGPWDMDWGTAEASSKPWETEWEETARPSPVESVLSGLAVKEGVGDNVTDVATGALGVTEAARKAVNASGNVSDADVAKSYLTQLHGKWEAVEGYGQAPLELQEAVLDASYNIGESVLGFPKLKSALIKGNYEEAALELLDTATVDQKSVKGIAKRRAEMYNRFSEDKITQVEQLDDGTILYRSGEDVILEYKPEGGKHEKSSPGVINISDDSV